MTLTFEDHLDTATGAILY